MKYTLNANQWTIVIWNMTDIALSCKKRSSSKSSANYHINVHQRWHRWKIVVEFRMLEKQNAPNIWQLEWATMFANSQIEIYFSNDIHWIYIVYSFIKIIISYIRYNNIAGHLKIKHSFKLKRYLKNYIRNYKFFNSWTINFWIWLTTALYSLSMVVALLGSYTSWPLKYVIVKRLSRFSTIFLKYTIQVKPNHSYFMQITRNSFHSFGYCFWQKFRSIWFFGLSSDQKVWFTVLFIFSLYDSID